MSLPYVITLSSIPPRFGLLGPTLDALLAQRARPESVTLYIPRRYRRFPDWDGALPAVPKGIDIRRTEEDLGPATKVLFAAEELRDEAVRILFCDDDRVYRPAWSRRLLSAAERRPGHAIVTSGFHVGKLGLTQPADARQPRARPLGKAWDLRYHLARVVQKIAYGGKSRVPPEKKTRRNQFDRSGYVDVGEGFGGFLVEPRWFSRDAWDIPPVMWAVDDVWLSGQLARKGIPIWIEAYATLFTTEAYQQVAALHKAVIDDADRAQANLACALYMRDAYGVWRD